MALEIPKRMLKELDSFLATRTCTDIDRTKFIPFDFNKVRDTVNQLTTCLVFNCNCHSYEDPVFVECEYTGVVVHLPAFWLEVPKELAFTYIYNILKEDLYGDIYLKWHQAGMLGGDTSGAGSGSGSGTPSSGSCCGCNPDGWQNV